MSKSLCSSQVVKDGLTAEKASAKVAEMKRMQAGDVSYEENSDAVASHATLEVGGVKAEKSLVKAKVTAIPPLNYLAQQP